MLYGNAANPWVRFAFHRVVCGDWWDEDPGSPTYNRFVTCRSVRRLHSTGPTNRCGRNLAAYPILAFTEYSTSPVVPGRGSAIFLHAAIGGPELRCLNSTLFGNGFSRPNTR